MDKNRNMFKQFHKRDIEILQVAALACVVLVMFFCRNSDRETKLGIFIVAQFILPFLFSIDGESKSHTSAYLLLFIWIGLFFGWWMSG
jgi:hypothetical protein